MHPNPGVAMHLFSRRKKQFHILGLHRKDSRYIGSAMTRCYGPATGGMSIPKIHRRLVRQVGRDIPVGMSNPLVASTLGMSNPLVASRPRVPCGGLGGRSWDPLGDLGSILAAPRFDFGAPRG